MGTQVQVTPGQTAAALTPAVTPSVPMPGSTVKSMVEVTQATQ